MTKRKGAIIPNPIDTEDTQKIVVCIPNTVEWLSLFTGLVSQLRYGWYWDRTTGDLDAIRDRAQRVYFEMQDQNGDCIVLDCDEVANCIETSEAVQDAIRNWLNNNYNFSASDYPPNIPLPASERSKDRAGVFNPDCDPDVLWAQSQQLVGWMDETITQALEAAEAASNTIEVAQVITSITGLDEVSADAVVGYGALLQDMIAENYAAGYSPTYRDNLSCEIFCAAKDDCEISIDDLFNIFKGRVEAYFGSAGTFDVLDDVIDYLTGNVIDTVIVVDAAFFLMWGGITLANWVVGGLAKDVEIGTKMLNTLLKLAVNDANSDWELLCEDCPPDGWTHEWDFTIDDFIPPYSIGVGLYVGTVGYQNDTGSGFPYTTDIRLTIAAWGTSNLTRIEIFANSTVASATAFRGVYFPSGGGTNSTVPGTDTGDYTIDLPFVNITPPVIAFQVSNETFTPGTNTIIKIRLHGDGPDPF